MKTKKLIATAPLMAVMFFATINGKTQSWKIDGNANIAAGTNYLGTSDANDLVIRTNAIERGRLLSTGIWRFGTATDNAQVDINGILSFNGAGVYQVAGNKYAFQYANDPDYGLFFNSTNVRYEFRNGTAIPVFYINASNGAPSIGNANANLNYILPSARGSLNQILRTDGSGNVSWSNETAVSVAGSNGVTVSGTYPNFTVSGANFWNRTGNAGTNAATNFIGTTDNVDFVLRTNNTERMRITNSGNVGIGISSPSSKLHLANGVDVTLASGGTLIMGPTTSVNLAMDNNELQARNNGAAAVLKLNEDGGNVIIDGNDAGTNVGINTTSPASDLHILHTNGFISNGLTIEDKFAAGLDWNIYSATTGDLWFSKDGTHVGSIDGTSGVYTAISDKKYKKDIAQMDNVLDKVMQLKPSQYHFIKQQSNDRKYLGMIAQEVQPIFPEVVYKHEGKNDNSDDYLTVDYAAFAIIAIKAIQEQQKEIDELKTMLKGNTQPVSQSTPSVSEISTTNIKLSTSAIGQNVPNPLRNTTSIRYNIPQDAKNAMLLITDMNGKTIKQLTVKAGNGILNIDASALNSGTYNYTLIIDGRNIETKKMVVAK